MTCAVKKIMISDSERLWRTLRKKAPRMGRSPRNGIFDSVLYSSLPIRPPMTIVSPSRRLTVVSALRFWKR